MRKVQYKDFALTRVRIKDINYLMAYLGAQLARNLPSIYGLCDLLEELFRLRYPSNTPQDRYEDFLPSTAQRRMTFEPPLQVVEATLLCTGKPGSC